MRALQRVFQADAALGAELNKEKASGLGHTGRLLEVAIERLQGLRAKLTSCADTERRELVAEYDATRARALELKWYLEVQREAMGLRKHGDLDQYFPIPGPLAK